MGKTAAALGVLVGLALALEAAALVTGLPTISRVVWEASDYTTLLPLALGALGGHFAGPRRRKLALLLVVGVAAELALLTGEVIPSAFLAGYAMGAIFWSRDERGGGPGGFRPAWVLLAALALPAGGCGGVSLPPGPPCVSAVDCNCWVYVRLAGWRFRSCPSPLPTPTPTPAPTPTPSPTPSPAPAGCGLPPGAGSGIDCPREAPTYTAAVQAAIDHAIALGAGVDGDRITDSGLYHATVVYHLRGQGFCAFFDGEEIALKRVNEYSEQWDIESAGGRAIRMYAATCRPAWSAIPSNGSPAPPPSPAPSPSPCVPSPPRYDCTARCAEEWAYARGNAGRTDSCYHFPTPAPGGDVMLIHNSPPHSPCPPGGCCQWQPAPADLAASDRVIDAQCRLVWWPSRTVQYDAETWLGADRGNCGPPIPGVTCPPSPPPGPPPPSPPPAGACPDLRCFGAAVHAVICDGVARVPIPDPIPAGCRVVLDATPYFGGCGPRYRCNAECDPATSPTACCGGRACEDPRGPLWRQLGGPPAGCDRGYLCRLDGLAPGTYRFHPCGAGWRDAHGVPNATPDTCGPQVVVFEVR